MANIRMSDPLGFLLSMFQIRDGERVFSEIGAERFAQRIQIWVEGQFYTAGRRAFIYLTPDECEELIKNLEDKLKETREHIAEYSNK